MLSEFKPGQAYQHMERGQHLERQGRLDEAMIEFKRAVEADPRIAVAHNALGQHYLRKGLLTKAADEFHTAALLSPGYGSSFNLGRVLTELERYAEAAHAFRECLSIDAGDPSARYELAYAQYAQGQFSEALAQFQSLVEEYPNDWELKTALGDCYIGLTNHAAATRTLQEALRSAPPNADTTTIRQTLHLARRHLEFSTQQPLGLKNRLYVDYGIVCLGSGRDDGLDVPIYKNHTFTYNDVTVTLSRLLRLIKEYDWHFDALLSVDEDSAPLTMALSQLLGLPLVGIEDLREDSFALVVLALGTARELCEVTLEHVSGRALSFALALASPLNQKPLTDIVGVYCHGSCTLPWKRIPKRSVEDAAASIFRALTLVPEEENRSEQLTYYAQEHKLLRFFELPCSTPGMRSET